MDKQKNNYIFYGVSALLGTFVFGFVIIYLLWIQIGTNEGLPGLFDYKAAAYGDSICLPILVGMMVMFIKNNEPISQKNRVKCFIAGMFFAVLGILMQAEWLINDETKLNWTIPEKHMFNIAGWYHSLFFIFMCFVIPYLLLNVRYVAKEKKENFSFSEKMMLILSIASGTLYVLCYINDDYNFLYSFGIAYIVVAIGVCILFSILLMNKNISRTEIMFIISNGLIIAIGVYNLIVQRDIGNLFTSIAGALSMAVIYDKDKYKIQEFVVLILHICISTIGIFSFITGISSIEDRIVMFCIFVVLIFTINNGLIREKKMGFIPIALGGLLLIDSIIGNDGFEKIAPNVFFLLIALLFNNAVTNIFSDVIDAEKQKNREKILEDEFKRIKTISYIKIVLIVFTIVSMLFAWLYKLSQANGKGVVVGIFNISIFNIYIICMGIALLLFFGVLAKRFRCFQYLSLIVAVGEYIILLLCCVDMFGGIKEYKLSLLSIIILIFAFFANLGGALLMGHGFRMNIAILREKETSIPVKILSKIIALGCLAVSYGTTILVSIYPNIIGVICSIIMLTIAFIIIPIVCAFVYKQDTEKNKVIPNSAIGGVAQDSFMSFLTIICASYMPNIFCGIIIFNCSDFYGLLENIICIIGLLLYSFLPVKFCLKNNKEHLIRQRMVAGNDENNVRIWEILRGEIINQSYRVCVAMLPYIFVIFICTGCKRRYNGEIGGYLKEKLRSFIDEYIEVEDYGTYEEEKANE